MEAKIEAYKEELKGIVNRIEDPIAKGLCRGYSYNLNYHS